MRIEQRLDGSLAVRHGERYLAVKECAADKPKDPRPAKPPKARVYRRGSDWDQHFDLKKGPKVWQAAEASGYRQRDTE